MEIQRTQTITHQNNVCSFAGFDGDRDAQERLNTLLNINAAIRHEKMLYRTHREEVEAALMKNPLAVKKAFAYFGLMLGTFPPASIFFKIFQNNAEPGLVALLLFVNLICAVVGYFSGKLVGKMVLDMEQYSWNAMLLTLPFIGGFWGIITGGAGGLLIFIIGAFFGAAIAATVGSIAVPAMAIFHRLLKRGEMIERNQFLPIAFGITFIISAFILGL